MRLSKKMEINELRGKAETVELQKVVDEMKTLPRFRQYVEQRKLSLLDSKFEPLDRMLELGILV